MEIEPRNIEIYDMNVETINEKENIIEFVVSCSKGTYIRSLCEDIATRLGTIGYMKELERTKVGDFTLNQSITIEELENRPEIVMEKIITIEELLKNNPKIILEDKRIKLFLNGVNIKVNENDGIYQIYDKNNKYIGTGIVKDKKIKRDIILKN